MLKTVAPPGASAPTSSPKAKKKNLIKFYGPIQVIVIDDAKGQYCKTVWLVVALGLANIFIGAVNMAALMYTAINKDAHVFLCTFAFHFFSAEAILSLNYANGWSTPMRLRHRRCVHILLQLCGIICAMVGAALVLFSKGVSASGHSITGVIATVLAGLSLLMGLVLIAGKKKRKTLQTMHMAFGMFAFVVSSVSLCLGCVTDAFTSWATMTITIFVIVFVVFYTMFIAGNVFMKCVSRI